MSRKMPWPGARLLLALAASLLATALPADEIELFDGQTVNNVRVANIEGGFLYFHRGEKRQRVPLHKVKTVTPEEREDYVEFVNVEDFEYKRRTGKLLTVKLNEERNRMVEPYVRLFVKIEDDRGDRGSKIFSNARIDDPSRTYDLSEINGRVYRNKGFFASLRRDEKVVAWHLEIWTEGELVYSKSESSIRVDDRWWKAEEISSRSLFTDLSREEFAELVEDPEEVEKDRYPFRIIFGQARFKTRLDDERVELSVGYRLESQAEERADIPEAKLYYVTENADRIRTVRSHTFPGRGRVKLVNGRYTHDMSMTFDDDYVLAATLPPGSDKERIIYWRLELTHEEQVVASRESNARIGQELPAKWWVEE